MRGYLLYTGMVIATMAGPSAAAAAPPSDKTNQCFLNRDYQGFKDIDANSFYIRVGVRDIYRIETQGACPMLTEPDARLITIEHGSDEICGPLDWQLRVAETPPGPSVGCIVKSQTRLGPEEAAAVPPSQRP